LQIFRSQAYRQALYMPKMSQNTFGGRPDPLGELKRSARPPSRNEGAYF